MFEKFDAAGEDLFSALTLIKNKRKQQRKILFINVLL